MTLPLVIGFVLLWLAVTWLGRLCKVSPKAAITGGAVVAGILIAVLAALVPAPPPAGTEAAVEYIGHMEEASVNFKGAGILLVGLIVVSVLFGRILFAIPLGGAVLAFGGILMILMFGLGVFHLTEAWGITGEAQVHLRYWYFGVVFVLLSILVTWAKTAE